MRKNSTGLAILLALLLLLLAWPQPLAAQSDINVTAAAGGIYPPGASYNGIPLNGLRFGIGITLLGNGSAEGQFQTTLLGVSALGLTQYIKVDGTASSGSSSAANTATFSGTCTVDMGGGTPPAPGVPFTVIVVTNADDQGTLTLTLGLTNLPAATVNTGTMTIK